MVEDLTNLVGTGNYCQAAEFDRAVADRGPYGKVLEMALEVYEVLVDGSGVLDVLGEPQANDLMRKGHGGPVHNFFDHVKGLGPVTRTMEGFELLYLVVDVSVLTVALSALLGYVGDAVHRVGAGDQPAALLEGCQNLLAQLEKIVGIEKLFEEKVAFFVNSSAEFFGVVFGVVGDAQFFKLCIHFKAFDCFTVAINFGLHDFYISIWLEISG